MELGSATATPHELDIDDYISFTIVHRGCMTMAARRPASVCLLCQSRQSLVGRRRFTSSAKRQLETVARPVTPEDDGFLLDNNKDIGKGEDGIRASVLPLNDTVRQWRLHSPIDELREASLGFDALYKRRDLRLEVLRNLSNPWPPIATGSPSRPREKPNLEFRLPEANAALIPHAAFRRSIQMAMGDKDIRKILRVQLLRCEWPNEILRVMAVAMQHKVTAQNLAVLAEPIIRALYRCRNNVTDPDVLRTLNVILARFKLADLSYSPILITMGLKFAARARSLVAMKKYLKLLRDSGAGMTSNVFRSIIAKFSIGHRGLGEIRNGRWRREQLIQVLKGFGDAKHLPVHQQYHLGSFLVRDDWQYLHGWLAVLARCKDSETLWHEWQMWKQSPARTKPRNLEKQSSGMTSRKRGDYWFVEQMAYSGDYEKAWKIVAETGVLFKTLKERIKTRLLDGVEFATVWDDDVREEMVRKYDSDLAKIEDALGVKWVSSDVEGQGSHQLVRDQTEALETLSSNDWKVKEDFGFPYSDEEAVVVEREERALHDAEEKELADDEARA